ncbi:MAG: aminotransferase class I/II-fold pyridoxal phosphate-dependent enzyme [Bacteroidaceae bacterium]|nr:aminotransferase class I/II-fold pyridoxal phosphate-dependent enzyme [Bacteroidaceae bacterium]
MFHFDTDYMEGAHPMVMQRLLETNLEQTPGYGTDSYCDEARQLIRKACGDDSLDVYFLVGGTQTNATVIDALLSHHEGVVAAASGHINVHESGAIEASGHKVLTLPSHNGKVDAQELKQFINDFYADETYEHMVAPGMLYISYPSEYGTIYTKAELQQLHAVCQKAHIPMFIDGARLGYGLSSDAADITLPELATLCEVFYIGGTKVGALFGECVVAHQGLLHHFTSLVKQHGALLAKGRLLGLQFGTLFTDNLYFRIARHAVEQAMRLKAGFVAKGYAPFIDSPTNQQFFTLPNDVMDRLAQRHTFEVWGRRGETHTTVRFVTSWATKPEDVEALIADL